MACGCIPIRRLWPSGQLGQRLRRGLAQLQPGPSADQSGDRKASALPRTF